MKFKFLPVLGQQKKEKIRKGKFPWIHLVKQWQLNTLRLEDILYDSTILYMMYSFPPSFEIKYLIR